MRIGRVLRFLRDGRLEGRPSHVRTRGLFLVALGAVYLCAFLSLWVQGKGLIGSGGILPVAQTLERVRAFAGDAAVRRFPTLFWLWPADGMLDLLCGGGAVLSALVAFGVARLPCLVLLWAAYLSLFRAGLVFLGFQWDTLLLECGFLAIFLAPAGLTARRGARRPVPLLALWAQRWLLFRLMFASGVVKLTSGDGSWRDGTALTYHYESQPLPTWAGWWVHQLPSGFHKATVAATFLVELAVPFLIFLGRIPRLVAFLALSGLQLTILATGNYGFFNLLTIALCIPLLDDAMLPWRGRPPPEPAPPWSPAVWARRVALGALLVLATMEFLDGLDAGVPWPGPVEEARVALDPLRLTSSYGLFRVMTKERPELVVEGSRDGLDWREYAFRYKPGDPARAPGFLQPHMPRLDWQMWFAALSRYERTPWFEPFLDQLLENAPAVVGLVERNPFPDEPPRYVRAMLWRYEFTTPEERRETGAWWKRTKVGLWSPILRR